MMYRKKPVVVEARELTQESAREIVQWLTEHGQVGNWETAGGIISRIEIETLEGVMLASPGDYIIKGIKGEFYPCKPDVFEATYEEVSE